MMTSRSQTPLSLAAQTGLTAAVKMLLDRGAQVEPNPLMGYCAYFMGCLSSHFHIVEMLLQHGASPNGDGGKFTPLYWAIKYNQHALGMELLSRGAVVDFSYGDWIHGPLFRKLTLLWWAVIHGDEPLVRLLLEKGANPDTEVRRKTEYKGSSKPRTPLKVAIIKSYDSIAELLLDYGADPSRDEYDHQPKLMRVA